MCILTLTAMSDPSPVKFLGDPLSNVARAERRNLLIASAIGLLVGKAGFVPTQFTTFGLEFQQPEQTVFIALVIGAIAYFACAFLLYGLTDFYIWRKTYQDYLEGVERASKNWTLDDQMNEDELRSAVPGIRWLYRWSKPSAIVRIAFEYCVPLLIAIVAVWFLLARYCTLLKP